MTPVSFDPLIAIVTFPLFKICGFYVEVPESTYLEKKKNCVCVCVCVCVFCETAKFHFVYLFSQRSVLCASHLAAFNPLCANEEPVF